MTLQQRRQLSKVMCIPQNESIQSTCIILKVKITRFLLISIFICSNFLVAHAALFNKKKKSEPKKSEQKKNNLSGFKIISAEKLDYTEGNSSLIGNVKIKLGEFTISSPKVLISSDKNGQASNARFTEDVILQSKDLKVTAPIMEIDVQKSLFKCFADDKQLVKTLIGEKGDLIFSGYQEYEIETGFGRSATKNFTDPNAIAYIKQVQYIGKDMDVVSDTMEMEIHNGKLQYVDFITNAVAKDVRQRTQADEIYYFPTQALLKAEGNAKIIYLRQEDPTYVFSDLVVYERDKKVFSAFSKDFDPRSEIYSKDTYGKARQIILLLDSKDQLDRAIFTGNAYAQFKDKSMLGHELLMNIKEKTLQTLVGRPKSQILKVGSVEDPKANKKPKTAKEKKKAEKKKKRKERKAKEAEKEAKLQEKEVKQENDLPAEDIAI